MKYTVCVDFDGVIHSYTSPWSETEIPDPPVPGALDWLRTLVKDFDVVLFTTRARNIEGVAAIIEWLCKWGFDPKLLTDITALKRPAILFIDDRAYRFTGDNFPSVQEIHKARPWNKTRPT